MSTSRFLGLVATVPLVVAGLAQGLPVQAAHPAKAEPAAPVQLLELTTSTAEVTDAGQAGLDGAQGPAAPDAAPSGTATADASPAAAGGVSPGGTAVPTGLDALRQAVGASVDPAADASVLTDPLEVDDFLVAGFTWTGSQSLPEGVQIYLRVREGGTWSSWYLTEASDAGPDEGAPTAGTEEFVTGGADAVQAAVVSSTTLPASLTLAMVPAEPKGEEVLDPSDTPVDSQAPQTDVAPTPDPGSEPEPAPETAPSGAAASEGATPASLTTVGSGQAAVAGPGARGAARPAAVGTVTTANGLPVGVSTRAEWGANSAYMTWTPRYVTADHVVVHHTAGTNSYSASQSSSIVRGIYYYHAVTNGWGDIGYHFLVDKYGQVFEGRSGTLRASAGTMVVGAHAKGANNGSLGISMMGTYTQVAPTSTQLDRVGRLAGWFLARSGVSSATATSPFTFSNNDRYASTTRALPVITGHRDVGYTACPGDTGYSLMWKIRSVAQSQMNGGAAGSGRWASDATGWWWVNADGSYPRSTWKAIGNRWYYFNASGYMHVGWLADGGRWYHLSGSGAMSEGWVGFGTTWYYMTPGSGAMATGWVSVRGTWYYLWPSGLMATGWLADAGSWYYLSGSGAMVTGTLTIDGRASRFDSSGRWLGYAKG